MKHTKRLVPLVLCLPLLASLLNAQPAHAAHGAIVRVTLTSVWATPSPDPMGITYDPRTQRLLISDAEVDEIPALWKGSNLFVTKRKGNLVAPRTLRKFTVEPEDLALDNRHRSLYVTDDDLDRVFRDKPGKDGLFGTRDDVAVALIRTRRFGSFDPEGLTWLPQKKMLIVSDSTSRRIYKIRQGKDRKFGTRDDVIRSFGIHRYGFTTAEDVLVTRFTHHLLIVSSRQHFILETTMRGKLVRKIDLTGLGIKAASGITFAPGTDGSKSRLYLTDSGVDNNVNPGENDGRLFELKIVP
ncbi:MAG: SdiA-regulated domain-containing protein [Actinomycetota bacterium]|nr:SdiA-regulated domain-containing protein [Actinomycetota bacterium]